MIRAVPYTSLWFGVILWVLIGGALLTGTGYILYQDFLFTNYGQHTMGMVDRKFLKVGQGKHGPTYTPCLVYQYQAGSLTTGCEQTVLPSTYASVSQGGPIPVLYVSTDPFDCRIDLPAENRQILLISYGLVAGTLMVAGVGTWVLLYTIKRNKLNRYLLANGLQCTGTVTDVKYDLVGKGRTKRYYLLLAFRDNQGREISGRTRYLKRGDENKWRESSPIWVYFDLRDSKIFTVDLNSGSFTG